MSDDCPYHDGLDTRLRQVEQTGAVMAANVVHILQGIDEIKEELRGNGTPGIKTRVDRIEQTEAKRGKQSLAVWGLIVAVLAQIVGGLLR